MRRKFWHSGGVFMAFCLLGSLSFYGFGQPAGASIPQKTITVNTSVPLTVNGPFRGFGLQDDTEMLLWPNGRNQKAGAKASDWGTYDAPRLKAMHLAWVRDFVGMDWYAPRPGVLIWNSPEMQALYQDLRLHQNDHTGVILTVMWTPSWINPEQHLMTATGAMGARGPDDAHLATYAYLVAQLIEHLHALGLTDVKYVSAVNELNHGTMPVPSLVEVYAQIEHDLAVAHAKGDVQLYGPDYSVPSVISQVARVPSFAQAVGFYDAHFYNAEGYFQQYVAQSLEAVRPTGKQLWLTEVGSTGSYGDVVWRPTAVNLIDALNDGAASLFLFNAQNQIYDGPTFEDNGIWGLWNFATYNPPFALRPAYYMYSNLTAHTLANVRVLSNSCYQPNAYVPPHYGDLCPNLRFAALSDGLSGPGLKHDTFIFYNALPSYQTIHIDLTGADAPGSETLYRYVVDSQTTLPTPPRGLLEHSSGVIHLQHNTFTDTVPPSAFVVYSAVNPVP